MTVFYVFQNSNYIIIIIVPCITSNPKVIKVKILGDLIANRNVKVCGIVIGGSAEASTGQLFITQQQSFATEEELKPISQSTTNKASNSSSHVAVKMISLLSLLFFFNYLLVNRSSICLPMLLDIIWLQNILL